MSDRIIGTGVFEGCVFENGKDYSCGETCDCFIPIPEMPKACARIDLCVDQTGNEESGNWKLIKPSAAPPTDQPTAQPTVEPTVPGWYWVRAYDETVTAKISELDIQTGVFAFNGKHTYGARCRFDGAKFSGPIQPPEGWVS